ncbi:MULTISPECIES: hypothetical protein [Bradyrhizobium]|uniref:hypothetical protein n=1 Tax=Bradyrhizobium TaxID=374 RepID=UPI00155E2972|nr:MULTISPECIES: hypothetical protein [unclassified Bradyrhizobium]NRB91010.1 hypothetical protein [Bradyrhizobium sp. WBAH10]QCJ91065.1 hypothetical protein DAA57_23045 [Bradyrhizobium yuanmingense]MDD1522688.1 hypothetical protein [Bradyrhizobium sp. WBAH30]MDD1547122.1 hypothetical protein [Bradyrhizobium sp. WBAH41]MDD1560735.1 hypothetical protein [Bradyrhizobium sp. WBAH23]
MQPDVRHWRGRRKARTPAFGGLEVGIGFSGTCNEDSGELEGIALAGKRGLRLTASLTANQVQHALGHAGRIKGRKSIGDFRRRKAEEAVLLCASRFSAHETAALNSSAAFERRPLDQEVV